MHISHAYFSASTLGAGQLYALWRSLISFHLARTGEYELILKFGCIFLESLSPASFLLALPRKSPLRLSKLTLGAVGIFTQEATWLN